MATILHNTLNATPEQRRQARKWVGDQLHVPAHTVTLTVAVAYVMRHYGEGRIGGTEVQGWEGFIADI